MNYSLFGGFVDFLLWALTIVTFITYFRVAYSNPGYVEGSIIMTELGNDDDLHVLDTYPAKDENKINGEFWVSING